MPKRFLHAGGVLQNRMWITGGSTGSANKNDTWWSTDGDDWEIGASNGSSNSFPARSQHTVVVVDTKL